MADSENDALVELEELELPLLAQLTESPVISSGLLTEPVTANPTDVETSVGSPSKGDVVNNEQQGTHEGAHERFDGDITSCVDVTSTSSSQSQSAAVVIGDNRDTILVESKFSA